MSRGRWDGSVRGDAFARGGLMPSQRRWASVVAVLGAGALLAGCGAYADGIDAEAQLDEQEIGSVEQAMTGGTLVGDAFLSVARLALPGRSCTSFKIGNRRFLTAAHCFDGFVDSSGTNTTTIQASLIPGDGADDPAITGVNDDAFNFTIQINGVFTHPSYLFRGVSIATDYYDVAEIVTPLTPFGTGLPLSSDEVIAANTSGTLIGFGEDTAVPNNNGKKQSGTFIVSPGTSVQSVKSAAGSVPFLGGGDSGGPLISNTNGQVLAVAFSGNQINGGNFSRVANIQRWVNDTSKGNDSSMFQTSGDLFFYNNKKVSQSFRTGLCMAASSNSQTPPQGISLQACSGPFALAEASPKGPGWTLLQMTSPANSFLIINRALGLCIGLNGTTVGNALQLQTCATTGSNNAQKWTFPTTDLGGPFRTLRITNVSSPTLCIGTGNGTSQTGTTTGTPVTQISCSGGDDDVRSWVATR